LWSLIFVNANRIMGRIDAGEVIPSIFAGRFDSN
jgi:hypothetical protein